MQNLDLKSNDNMTLLLRGGNQWVGGRGRKRLVWSDYYRSILYVLYDK
jgi:hypothetical protein